MAKAKKRQAPNLHTATNPHIEFDRIHGEYTMKEYITIGSISEISVFGHNPTFEWGTTHNGQPLRVSLPRNSNEREVVITGDFPNEIDRDRGTTHSQLNAEFRRVLRQLD